MLAAIGANRFLLTASTIADGTRAAAAQGAAVTPAQNAYGSYAQVLGALAYDAYELEVLINSVGASAEIRDALVTIGFDTAGGSAYGGLGGIAGNEINHLLASAASPYLSSAASGGVVYRFPLRVPAGTSIGAKASVSGTNVSAIRVAVRARCRPTRPDLLWAGRFVRTFGAVPGSSCGTAITPGSTSEGAWVALGLSVERDPLRWFEVGLGVGNAVMTNTVHEVDVAVGSASAKQIVIANAPVVENVTETLSKAAAGAPGYAAIGDAIYVRAQSGPNNAVSGVTAAVYAVGG